MHHMQKIISYISLQTRMLISPPHCAHCKLLLASYTIFCTTCEQKIAPIVSSTITLSSSYRMTIFAISNYQEPIKSLILAKSRSDLVASKQLGELIWQKTFIRHAHIDCFISIPLHWTRYAYRGYNQADEIAHVLANYTGKPVVHALKRTKKTAFQSSLTHSQRLDNVKKAFTIIGDGSQFYNKHIMLVDDLMTTSATLQSIAKMLIPYKPASINAVVACRVV